MFDFIQGKLTDKGPGYAVITQGGIGFYLHVPISSCDQHTIDNEIKLFTHFTLMRGEVPVLYGFNSPEQRTIFNYISGVSGIGPRTAMHILGVFSLAELSSIITAKDENVLTKVPRLGTKKARLLILELQDKLPATVGEIKMSSALEAEQALVALGYKKKEAAAAINKVYKPELNNEEMVKQALRNLTKIRQTKE